MLEIYWLRSVLVLALYPSLHPCNLDKSLNLPQLCSLIAKSRGLDYLVFMIVSGSDTPQVSLDVTFYETLNIQTDFLDSDSWAYKH